MTAHIYVKAFDYQGFNWDNCYEIPFNEYSIDESDFRNKTATFSSPARLKLGDESYAVKITNSDHETFTGIILKRDEKIQDNYTYQCQDWNRLYMTKPTIDKKDKVYNLIKLLLNYCGNSEFVWQGLLAANRYEQKRYGSIISFNPMTNIKNLSVKDKTVKEVIQQLIYSQKPYIDIHYNNVGVMQFTPYHINSWLKPIASFHYKECLDFTYSFDTTNIITHVTVGNKNYKFNKLFNNKTNALSKLVSTGISLNDNTSNVSSNTVNKTSKTNNKTNNPYRTKNKEVWVNMDVCWGHSSDNNYLNTFCKELKRLGWKVHNLGVKPSLHTNYKAASKCRNGIWLTLDNGVDCEVFRHFGHDNWFKGQLVKNKSRAVIGLINNAGNIKRGGKYYNYLGMAHDGTGKGNPY